MPRKPSAAILDKAGSVQKWQNQSALMDRDVFLLHLA